MEVLTEIKQTPSQQPQGPEAANIGKRQSIHVDAEDLAAEIRKSTEAEVRFDAGTRALYSTDGSNYRQVPIGVVIPRSKQDVIQTVALCRRFGAPYSRGAAAPASPASAAMLRWSWISRSISTRYSSLIQNRNSPELNRVVCSMSSAIVPNNSS